MTYPILHDTCTGEGSGLPPNRHAIDGSTNEISHVTKDEQTRLVEGSANESRGCVRQRRSFIVAIVVTITSCFSTAYAQTYLFSFLPEMILWLGYREADKGLYGGIIASSYYVGQALSAYIWGRLSDTRGRKATLIATLIANSVLCLLFGFSLNFYMAVGLRFANGIANGAFPIAKTIIYDSSDESNLAMGLSFVSVGFATGITLGPAVGGYLVSPVKKYPSVFGKSWFLQYLPFCIPSFMGSAMCAMCVVLVALLYTETRHRDARNVTTPPARESAGGQNSCTKYGTISESSVHPQSPVHTKCDSNDNMFEYSHHHHDNSLGCSEDHDNRSHRNERRNKYYLLQEERHNADNPTLSTHGDSQLNLSDNRVVHYNDFTTSPSANVSESVPLVGKTGRCFISKLCNRLGRSSMVQLLRSHHVFPILVIYMLYSTSVLGSYEIFPIWASTTKDLGGLHYGSSDIAFVYAVATFPALAVEVVILPLCERRLGAIKSMVLWLMFASFLETALPLTRLVHDSTAQWVCICLYQFLYEISVSSCFATFGVVTSNSVSGDRVGSVNGVVSTGSAIARAMAPLIGGNIFAASITSHLGPPIDVNLTFAVFGATFWICSIASCFLPRYLNNKWNNDADLTC